MQSHAVSVVPNLASPSLLRSLVSTWPDPRSLPLAPDSRPIAPARGPAANQDKAAAPTQVFTSSASNQELAELRALRTHYREEGLPLEVRAVDQCIHFATTTPAAELGARVAAYRARLKAGGRHGETKAIDSCARSLSKAMKAMGLADPAAALDAPASAAPARKAPRMR